MHGMHSILAACLEMLGKKIYKLTFSWYFGSDKQSENVAQMQAEIEDSS